MPLASRALTLSLLQEGSGRVLVLTDAPGYAQAGADSALEPGSDVQHDHDFAATISLYET